MFNLHLKNLILSESSLLSKTVIALAKQLKTLYDVELHKRKFKLTTLKILKAIISRHSENQNTFFITTASREKTRAVKAKFSKFEKEFFSFDWVIDSSLITTTIKTFLVEIKDLQDYLTKIFEISSASSTNYHSNVSISSTQNRITNEIIILKTFSNTDQNEISINFDEVVSFFELSTSLNSLEKENVFFEQRKTSSRRSHASQNQYANDIERSQASSSQTSTNDEHLIDQTSKRVHSTIQFVRVQTKKNLFESFYFTRLRELLTTRFSLFITFLSQQISKNRFLTILISKQTKSSEMNKVFSEEYFVDASSIIFRQYNIQSFQELIQRNFDFLESILFKVNADFVTRQLADSSSTSTNQNSLISIESYSNFSNFEFDKKEAHQNKITNKKSKKIFSSQSTTSQHSSTYVNLFIFFSSLSFDSLFQ
jgi:hypothetical protein